ncbi:hypothetical protein COO60DRAFT_1523846, partial [Scenedesmus sp. NREL 46B-D3]
MVAYAFCCAAWILPILLCCSDLGDMVTTILAICAAEARLLTTNSTGPHTLFNSTRTRSTQPKHQAVQQQKQQSMLAWCLHAYKSSRDAGVQQYVCVHAAVARTPRGHSS